LAALARATGQALCLEAAVFAADGSRLLRGRSEGGTVDAEAIGRELAERLLAQGAGELIAQAKA
jgi:hydroxymethylbilane synthase